MNDQRYYAGLKEMKLVTNLDDSNKLLLSGWELLRPLEIHDPNATTRVHYLMGLFGEVREKASRPSNPPAGVTDKTVLDLPWEASDYQGVDKWVPIEKVPNDIRVHFQKNGTRTDKGSYKLTVGGYDMYLSSKALSRYTK